MNEWEQGLNFTIGVYFVILLYRPTVPYISLWVQFMCVCVCVKTSGQWLKWKHARIALKISSDFENLICFFYSGFFYFKNESNTNAECVKAFLKLIKA